MFTNETDRMLADGGVMQEGGTVDPVSGNDVPPGAMQEEVRDDIDAKLSEGEFVIPADVVRYIGLSTLMKMRDKAKEGLKKMEEIGQMGNAEEVPNAEALHGGESEEMDEESFGAEVDSILGEEEETPAFAEGGYVDPANEATYKDAPVRGFEMVRMVNAAGNVIYIPHTNGKPMLSVPAGYTPSLSTLPPVTETPTTPSPSTGGAGAGGAGGSDSGGGGGGGPAGGGPAGGGILGGSYGVGFDEQGNVTAGKSGVSSGQALFGGTLASMLTGIPGLSLAAMAANKVYSKAAEAEAAGLRASIADTMGVNANMNTLAATPGISGTGGPAASAAASAAAAAVAAGYSDEAVAAASQAAATATIGGASATQAAEVGAAAAATVAGDIDARDASAGYASAAAQAAAAATTANDIDATDASAGYSGNGSPASQGQTSSQSGEGNPAESNTTSSSTGEGNPGESGGGFSNDAGGTESSGSLGFVKGGFVSKKKNVLAKSNKGLASRK